MTDVRRSRRIGAFEFETRGSGLAAAFLWILWAPTRVLGEYNMWHAVDPQSVVCPLPVKPSGYSPGLPWPTEQAFEVQINFDNDMDESRPHVVSFMRQSSSSATITFTVVDSRGVTALPEKVVQLDAANLQKKSECECVGVNTGVDTAKYGTDYGTSCKAWDNVNCATWFPDLKTGPWCCQEWCYVSKSCTTAFKSEISADAYFAYTDACGGPQTGATCGWDIYNPCNCIGVETLPQWTAADTQKYGQGYGAMCDTWDYHTCGEQYEPEVLDSWCCQGWCWVKQECSAAIPSAVWPGLFYSLAGCPDNPEFVNTCPYKKESGQPQGNYSNPNCSCTGEPPANLNYRRSGDTLFPTDYGTRCQAWDKDKFSVWFPKDDPNIFSCQSWCYVDAACSSGNPSLVFDTYWSYEACPDDGFTLRDCNYSSACKILGDNPGLNASTLNFYGADYGTSCKAWDATDCRGKWSHTEVWKKSDDRDWCCDTWAYVNITCPIADQSSIGADVNYAYNICDPPSEPKYNEDSNACEAAPTRRLGSRRRAGGGFYSSPRRRSPTRTSSSASHRRRGTSYTPPRRRRAPPPRPAPPAKAPSGPPPSSPRRRSGPRRRDNANAPTPAAPGINPNTRRRTTGVSGQANSLDNGPRRRASDGTVRRRTSTYGYNSPSRLQNNYQGSMPQQTSYGYSGPGPQKNSKIPLMMAAGGGLAAGAVIGAGSYYAYHQMSTGRWNQDWYSNRRYCRAPTSAGPQMAGRMMSCLDCEHYYGSASCSGANDCYSGNRGCDYRLDQNMRRDDLMSAGFVPQEYEPPLKIKITKIEGADYTQAKLCPQEGAANDNTVNQFESAVKESFSVDLFVTLTEMQNLATVEQVSASVTHTTPTSANLPLVLAMVVLVHMLSRLTAGDRAR